MRTETRIIKIYKFEELEEKIQEKIISNWRDNDDYFLGDDNEITIKEFERIIPNLYVKNWSYDSYNHYHHFIITEDSISELSGVRLWKWLNNNLEMDEIMKENCCLSGYFTDNDILQPIVDFYKKPTNISLYDLIDDCLSSFMKCCSDQYKYWSSEKCIREEIEINEYEFTENGAIY